MKQCGGGVGTLTVRINKVMQIEVINVFPLTGEVKVMCKFLKCDINISAQDSGSDMIMFKGEIRVKILH